MKLVLFDSLRKAKVFIVDKFAFRKVNMPSAASVKIDKQLPSAEIALADNGNTTATPLRQAITIIEHKIRNLEKRKVSLVKLPSVYVGLYVVLCSTNVAVFAFPVNHLLLG